MLRTRALLAAASALAAVGVLSGCAAVGPVRDLAAGLTDRSFADLSAAEGNWSVSGVPEWIPEDAHEIRHRVTKRWESEILVYTSATAPTGDCAPAERTTRPAIDADWAPESLAGEVVVCDDWQIQQVGDHWHAWRSDGREAEQLGQAWRR